MNDFGDKRFGVCLPFTLAQECPYPSQWGNPRNFSNDPGDPGGKTMDGLIQTEYDRYRTQLGEPRRDVRECTEVEGDDIYYHNYWLPYCPELPPGLDLSFFDAEVNEGNHGVKILQQVLGVAADGKWGPKTEAAVVGITDVAKVIRAFTARRAELYRGFRGFTRFGRDWERRTAEIGAASLKMVGS